MIYDPVVVDLSRVVPGGKKDAVVTGLILQELDQSKNVIFEWRSWDHYSLSDTYEPLTTQRIDPYHGNAIEVDTDGNWLISARHLDEITKIDRKTGAILWRLGGKANQFTFTNDTRRFKHQHDIRRLPNGNITLFDNSNGNEPQYSRAVEYEINEAEKTITRVWEYQSKPEGYSAAMGSAQRLDNGNTVIGWGWASAMAVSEVNPDGDPVFELNFPIPADPQKDPRFVSYRAFRYPWEGNPINPPSLAGKVEPTGLRLGFSWNGATQVASWEIYGGSSLQSMTKLTSLTKTGFETQTVLSGIDAAQCIYAAVPLDKDGNKLRQSNYYVSAGCQPYQDYIPLARK